MGHVMRKSVSTDTVTVLCKDLSEEKVLRTVEERWADRFSSRNSLRCCRASRLVTGIYLVVFNYNDIKS